MDARISLQREHIRRGFSIYVAFTMLSSFLSTDTSLRIYQSSESCT